MSHHIYTTPAVVLESFPGREADRRYTLFTREFGIIRATATGVRQSTSKLRYALQEFSVLDVSLVRGREWWRITNASAGENLFWRERKNQAVVEAVARIFRLLIRLVPGEEKNELLYDEISRALDFLSKHELSGEDVAAFEQVMVLRVLRDLGYVGEDAKLTEFFKSDLHTKLLKSAQTHRRQILTAINYSLQQSQL
jgi:DNA repair protein RecO